MPFNRRVVYLCTLLVTLVGLAACDDGPSAPATAAVLEVVTGDAQEGTVASPLGSPLTVEARDQSGSPLSGVTVSWSVVSGGGDVSSAETTTGSDGQASVTWVLGTVAGEQRVRASSGSAVAEFTAAAEPGAPAEVAISPVSAQLSALGLTQQFNATVRDEHGNEITGPSLSWSSSDDAVATVTGTGLATATGNGSAEITASAASALGSADIVVRQTATSIVVESGDGQTGVVTTELAEPLVVAVTDATGAPAEGVEVTWETADGDGSLSVETGTTNADGTASATWTLGTDAGQQTATATVTGEDGSDRVATFTATADAGDAVSVQVSPASVEFASLGDQAELTPIVLDAFDNVLIGAEVTWSIGDPSVASIDENGFVMALQNGSTVATVTHEGLSGTADIVVSQVVTSITVAPDPVGVFIGSNVLVTPTGFDAGGSPVPSASFAFTATPDGIVELTPNGINTTVSVQGVAEGTATLTVTPLNESDPSVDVQITVEPPPQDFEPDGDTSIGGEQDLGNVTIPAGVVVTVTEDLVINAIGDVTIDGTLAGDCVSVEVKTTGALTLNGVIQNQCSTLPETQRPGLTLVADGAWSVEDATVESNGAILVSNAEGQGSAAGLGSLSGATDSCTLIGSKFSIFDRAARGEAGRPQGGAGANGAPVEFRCSDDILAYQSVITAQSGGLGGRGDSTEDGVEAVGGRGGDGGNVIFTAGGDVTMGREALSELTLIPGKGGDGGLGQASSADARARGGDGGHGGRPVINVGGTLTIVPGGLTIDYRTVNGGDGGTGAAEGSDGADATDTAPAEKGGNATAVGGKGGNLAGSGTTRLVADILQGGANVSGTGNIQLLVADGETAGDGGGAVAHAGNGGNGSKAFKDGADAGDEAGTGGDGGDANVVDDRTGSIFLGVPGDGGNLVFRGFFGVGEHRGGDGADMCMPGMVGPGGNGGRGGTAVGVAGNGGFRGGSREGTPGITIFANTLNGGNGGDGESPGNGGDAGIDDGVVLLGAVEVTEPVKEPGLPGNNCKTNYNSDIVVQSDPNGHEPFIGMTNVDMLMVILGVDGKITISGGGVWVTLEGTVTEDGTFSAQGRGSLAGFSDVLVTFEGTLTLDEDGNPTGLMGTLTADAENDTFPPNDDGDRNPAVYDVSATVQQGGS